MKNSTKILFAAAALVAAPAFAAPFYIEAGDYGYTTGYGTDPDTRTDALGSLGVIDTVATSIYFGLTPGSAVWDTNDPTRLSILGIPYSPFPDSRRIVSLNPPEEGVPLGDLEAFTNAPNYWGRPIEDGKEWGMTYTYTLEGEINSDGSGVDFHTGVFDIFFEDGGPSTQVLRMKLTDFDLTAGGSTYTTLAHGTVDFSWVDSTTTDFIKNFFVDEASGRSFYDLWFNDGDINPVAVGWRMDTNIDCPTEQPNCQGVLLPSQLTFTEDGVGYRKTTVDGTLQFNAQIPEPASLALLGLGLTGLGLARRRSKKA